MALKMGKLQRLRVPATKSIKCIKRLACGILLPQAVLRLTSTPHQHRHRKTAFACTRSHSAAWGGERLAAGSGCTDCPLQLTARMELNATRALPSVPPTAVLVFAPRTARAGIISSGTGRCNMGPAGKVGRHCPCEFRTRVKQDGCQTIRDQIRRFDVNLIDLVFGEFALAAAQSTGGEWLPVFAQGLSKAPALMSAVL